MTRCACIAVAVLSLTSSFVRAHDPGLSTLSVRRASERLEFSVIVTHADLASGRRASSPTCDARHVLSAWLDGRSMPVQASCRLHDAQHTAFEGAITAPRGGQLSLELTLLDELPRGHRTHARVLSARGAIESERLLSRGSPPLQVQIAPATRRNFMGFGIVLFALIVASVGGLRRAFSRQRDYCKLPPHGL